MCFWGVIQRTYNRVKRSCLITTLLRYVNFELLTYICISYGCRLFMQCKVKGHNVLLELTACFIEGAVAI